MRLENLEEGKRASGGSRRAAQDAGRDEQSIQKI
jgi:hypothetical protein